MKYKQTRMFDGKRYTRRTQHTKKSKAKETAQMYRNVGAKARVVKEKHPEGVLWVVFRYG